ncbi:MAG: tetratricopeptide repeat protein [Gammaproteobacteria bacterium]|nr:tetratricopeptide repeat protein [Gammaproteobacteria bacterium]
MSALFLAGQAAILLPVEAPAAPQADQDDSAPPGVGVPRLDAGTTGDPDALYRRRFRDAIAAGLYDESELAAKERLESLLASETQSATKTASALSDLALAQRLGGKWEAALQNYETAIDLLQRDDDMLSRRLVRPLEGLAATYRDSGNYGEALRTYDRALHISHVNEGPHTVEQVHILNGMVETNLAAGEVGTALELLDRMTTLYERKYSLYALEMLPVLHDRAELLNQLDRHREERHVYRRIAKIKADHYGTGDPVLIDTYLALGRTYLHEANEVVFRSEPTTRNGESYFQRALAVAEANANADAGPDLLARCVIALGDYYTVMDSVDLARLQYGRAWQLLSETELLDRRLSDLERPVPLRRLALGRYPDFNYGWSRADVDHAELLEGHITARFSVNDRGRVKDIELIEADPPGFSQMETRVRYGVKDFIYRPVYRDGEPVESGEVLYRHDFFYRTVDVRSD